MQKKSFIDIYKYPEFWDESIKIYTDSFKKHEREESNKILKNINNGKYKMFSYIQENEVIGFYILDINHTLRYTMCCFLAIKESKRDLGFGSKVCSHAISYFNSSIKSNWLLIEAQERQAKLYIKLGFKRINLDYKVPIFNSNNSIQTNLMIIQKAIKIDKTSLSDIIKDIFCRGYSLNKNDQRVKSQLIKIKLAQTL